MIPGIGGQINANQITQVKKRLKKNKAMTGSMTKKEIANPDLFVKDKLSQSRLRKLLLNTVPYTQTINITNITHGELDS